MRYRLLIVAFALLPGCYGDPTLPTADEVPAEVASAEPGTPSEAPVVAERGGRPSSGDEPAQTRRIQELGAILTKLGPATPGSSPASRPGADSWRPAELEKLTELCEACCAAGGGPCAACLGEVADAELASDEIWSLMGLFLGVLRPRAAEGAATIGRRLLLDDVGAIRDRAFRVIVGSGAARRGQPDSDKRRATSVPIAPRVGEPVLVVVEQVSSCPHVVADAKGPDSSGRVDVNLTLDCPEPEAAKDPELIPRASRAVWAWDAGPMPESGLTIWMKDAAEPILEVRSPPRPQAPRD